jgi:hypothetical protein
VTRGAALRRLELLDQHRQRAVDDDGGIAGRDDVSQQVARAVEPGPRLGTRV